MLSAPVVCMMPILKDATLYTIKIPRPHMQCSKPAPPLSPHRLWPPCCLLFPWQQEALPRSSYLTSTHSRRDFTSLTKSYLGTDHTHRNVCDHMSHTCILSCPYLAPSCPYMAPSCPYMVLPPPQTPHSHAPPPHRAQISFR